MKLKFSILLFAVFSCFSLSAQDVDEIVNAYIEVIGGADAIKKIKTQKTDLTMTMGPMELGGTMVAASPDKSRTDIDFQGKSFTNAYNGEVAWMINPMMGEDPQKMPEAEAEEIKNRKFEPEFIDYKEKGHAIEYVGTSEVEGAECHELKMTKKDGTIEHHYFDTENNVLIMTKTTIKQGPGKGQQAETYLSDYQEVDGLMFPFFMETKANGQSVMKMTFKNMVLNPEIDESIFDFPGAETKADDGKEPAASKEKEMEKEGKSKGKKGKKKANK